MSWYDKIFGKSENRNYEPYTHNYGGTVSSFFSNNSKIPEKDALKIPAVASSVELITSAIAQLPIELYKKNHEDGSVVKIEGDYRYNILNSEPNEVMNGHNFKKRIVKDYLLHGASYNYIERDLNTITGIYNLPIEKVQIVRYVKDGFRYTGYIQLMDNLNNGKENVIELYDTLMILKDTNDGITSDGILVVNEDTIMTALNEMSYSKGVLQNGSVPLGVVEANSKLSSNAITNLRDSFANIYGGARNTGKTIILEEGLKYSPISLKPNELDLTNQKKSTISEIARIFNLPESMINSDANKYGSNEANNITFLQYCLSPIIESLETSLTKTFLLESEKEEGLFFRIDTSEILRTTEKEKIETALRGFNGGLLTQSEARFMINKEKVNNDLYQLSLGKVFLNIDDGNMVIPNMSTVLDKDGKVVSSPNATTANQSSDMTGASTPPPVKDDFGEEGFDDVE